jgi:hypothetical protein
LKCFTPGWKCFTHRVEMFYTQVEKEEKNQRLKNCCVRVKVTCHV